MFAWCCKCYVTAVTGLPCTLQLAHDSDLRTAMQGWSPLRCAIAAWESPTLRAPTRKVGNSFQPHVSWHTYTSQSQVIQALSVQLLRVCMRGHEHMMGRHCLSHCALYGLGNSCPSVSSMHHTRFSPEMSVQGLAGTGWGAS